MEFSYFLLIEDNVDLLFRESPSPHCFFSADLTGNQILGGFLWNVFDCSKLASLYILLFLPTKNTVE